MYCNLYMTLCSLQVFVVDFIPRLDLEASYQNFLRQAYRSVSADMGT